LKGRAALNCAFDLCAKLPKDIEKKILRENRRENRKKIYVVSPVKRVTCDLYADPHARSFDGAYWEAQTCGAWVLHQGPSIIVHYLGKKFGSWVGVVDWIVDVRGDIVRAVPFNGLTVNGQPANPTGKFRLPNGGSITKAGNKITISSEVGEEVDFISYGSFYNAYVRSNLVGVSGLCSHQFVRSSAFGHKDGEILQKPKLFCPQKQKHLKYCKGKGLKGIPAMNCAFDLCAKLPRAIERRILRQNKRENRQVIKRVVRPSPFFRRQQVRIPPLIRKPLFRAPKVHHRKQHNGNNGAFVRPNQLRAPVQYRPPQPQNRPVVRQAPPKRR